MNGQPQASTSNHHEQPPITNAADFSPPPTHSTSPLPSLSDQSSTAPTITKKTRSRNGCLTCRGRKKKCGLEKPICSGCSRLALECVWEDKAKSAMERREKREKKKREKVAGETSKVEESVRTGKVVETTEDLQGLDALATAGLISSMEEYSPQSGRADPVLYEYSPHDTPVPLPLPSRLSTNDQTAHTWTPFLSTFAPTPFPSNAGQYEIGWPTTFLQLGTTPTSSTPHQQVALPKLTGDTAATREGDTHPSDLDVTSWLNHGDLPLTFSSLVRSPSPAPFFDPDLSSLFPSFRDFDTLELPPSQLDQQPSSLSSSNEAALAVSANRTPAVSSQTQTSTTISRAASFLASSDFAFTQAYLLSHYTTSLAQHVSIASSNSPSSSPSTSSSSSRISSANLFLSLIPHAHQNSFLMHSILSWSSAHIAAASSSTSAIPSTTSTSTTNRDDTGNGKEREEESTRDENGVMGNLSDELGNLAEGLLEREISLLDRSRRKKSNEEKDVGGGAGGAGGEEGKVIPHFEPVLAGVLMLCQAAICRGRVELWRERLAQAAQIIDIVGGLTQCRSPLARQLVRNLLYHDVLSSSSAKHGLLLDYSSLKNPSPSRDANGSQGRSGRGEKDNGGKVAGMVRDEETVGSEEKGEEVDEREELDTLMGTAEPIFLLIGRITALARQKHDVSVRNQGNFPEDELGELLKRVDEVKVELELEKTRLESFVAEHPDLAPHGYFHEVFRLAALLYLQMVTEVPPRAYPVLLLVRKMLSLFEVIIEEKLPGLCSCHFALYVMHLNSTPLVSPHATLTDRQRSTRVFDHHMQAFTFLNTKRSRFLIEEVHRRSNEGRLFVDPDEILSNWGWDLNFA